MLDLFNLSGLIVAKMSYFLGNLASETEMVKHVAQRFSLSINHPVAFLQKMMKILIQKVNMDPTERGRRPSEEF